MAMQPLKTHNAESLKALAQQLEELTKEVKGLIKRKSKEKMEKDFAFKTYHVIDKGIHQLEIMLQEGHHQINIHVLEVAKAKRDELEEAMLDQE